jgi:hypothetical protein
VIYTITSLPADSLDPHKLLQLSRHHWAIYGLPKVTCVDQGTEFVPRDLDLWSSQRCPAHGRICVSSHPLGATTKIDNGHLMIAQ